jgi:hypothetical protein
MTDDAGFYDTGFALAPGSYKVAAFFGGLEAMAYNQKFSAEAGDPVTVIAGETTTGIDIALPALGQITGHVTNAATSAPISGATIDVWNFNFNTFIGSVTTDVNGLYTFLNLGPFNAYRVRARATNFGFVFWNNKDSAGTADVVTVPAGGSTTLDFALGAGGGITGTVIDVATGLPFTGAQVSIDIIDGSSTNFSVNNFDNFAVNSVAADGTFNTTGRILAPGLYKLRARLFNSAQGFIQTFYPNGFDLSTAQTITVAAGADTPNINIVMQRGGTITGTVLDRVTGAPMPATTVRARRVGAGTFFGDFSVAADASGNYRITGLHPGEWLITAEAPGHMYGWYSGNPNSLATDFSSSAPITIVGTGSVSGVNLNLQPGGGQIRGRVTRSDNGQPVQAGTSVNIRGPWPRTSSVNPASVLTDALGNYSLNGISPGRYTVEADRTQVPNGTAVGWYPLGSVSRASGVAVTVTDGAVITTDFQVFSFTGNETPRTIRGTLRDQGNQPIRSARVFAIEPGVGGSVRFADVFHDGSFVVDGLAPGRYLLGSQVENTFSTVVYPSETTGGGATLIDVTAGDVSGINYVLPNNAGSVTGTITRSDNGQPILGASISVFTYLGGGVNGATSRVDGSYLIRGVVPGTYKVRVSAPGFVTKYFVVGDPAGVRTLEAGSFVTVTAGGNTPGIDMLLDLTAGALTGTVKRQDNQQPLVATGVLIDDAATGNRVQGVSTDTSGVWRTEGLGAGTYKLRIGDGGTTHVQGPGGPQPDFQSARYATQWYSGKPTQLAADSVSVGSVGVTGGIDALVSANRGAITGTVTHGGTPLPDATVEILDAATGGLVRRAVAGSDGTYTVQGLAPGTGLYVGRLRNLGFADQFYPGVPVRTSATPVSVAADAITPNIDFAATQSSDITGVVTYVGAQTGTLRVRLYSDAGFTQQVYETAIANFASGQAYGFALPAPDPRGLLPGTYFVKAFLDSNGNGNQDPTEAVGTFAGGVTVAANTIAAGKNIAIANPAATTNTAPIAQAQSVIVVQSSTNNSIILTGLDTETATANLTYAVLNNPLHGTLTTTIDPRERRYTPTPGFSGTDTFTFTVTDRGDPDNCGVPGPGCSAPLTSAAATVSIQVNPSAGTTSKALGEPAISAPPEGSATPQALGNLQIDENATGALSAGATITVTLPGGLTFASTPSVSFLKQNGAALGSVILASPSVLSFTLSAPSTAGPASLLVSGIEVLVAAGFLEEGVTSVAIQTTIAGANPGITPATVQNGTALSTVAGPSITTVTPSTAAQGATGRVVVITGANFALDATVSFGSGVTVTSFSVDSSSQITASLTVASGAALGPRDVAVTNVGAGQSVTQTGAFEITAPPTVTGASGPLQQGLDNQLVTITGTNFEPPTTSNPSDLVVTFSGTDITVVTVGYTSPTSISAIVNVSPTAPFTSYDVTVMNPDGGVATGFALVTVDPGAGGSAPPPKSLPTTPPPPPSLANLSPDSGPLGATVVIGGSAFSGTAANNSVTFAGANGARVPATVTLASSTSLTVTVPSQATTGNVTVAVSGVVTNAVSFTVTTPVLSGVVPGTITTDANAVKQVQLSLTGSRFLPGAIVTFGGPASDVTPIGTTVSVDGTTITQIVSVVPNPQTGPRDVTVTNPGACPIGLPGCLSSTLAGGVQIQLPPTAGFNLTLPDFSDTATYLPSVTQVTLTRGPTGACEPATKVVTPTSVRLQAQFITTSVLTPPVSVTFTIAPSALPGTATNEDCELDPTNPAKDFSIGVANLSSQQVVVADSGGGIYDTMLYSYDWGGKVTITVTGTTSGTTATGTLLLPVDADGDDLPDAYEKDALLNADQSGANALNYLNADQNANGIKDRDDRFARDGLSNFEKYRGVYLAGPIAGKSGALAGLQRLGAGFRHLFVRGRGFRDDPAVPAGSCGIDSNSGVPIADPTLSVKNPCPVFQVGTAFQSIGIATHNVSASFVPGATELPGTSFVNPAQPMLDLATVIYEAAACKGTEPCDTTTKFGVRQWGNNTLGFTPAFGTATTYGATTVYKRAVESYFNNRPYQHRTNDPARVITAPDGTPMLAPITIVGDSSPTGPDNGMIDTGEATINGQLLGDTYIPGRFDQHLSALDVNNDGCIELPTVADPTTLARCDPAADVAAAPSATKQQVVRSVTTHELGHGTGVNTHTSDATDIMYLSTINYSRDGHFSPAAAGLIQIHNKGLQ